MNTIKINKAPYYLPSEWNELTKEQLFYIVRLFISGLSRTQILLRTLLKVLGLQAMSFKSVKADDGNAYLFKISKKVKFLLTDTQLLYLIENSLTFLVGETEDKETHSKWHQNEDQDMFSTSL